jgi:hypothetical protein
MTLSWRDYNMGFWRGGRMLVLNVTRVDTNGHQWTPVDTSGHRWTPVDTSGQEWTFFSQ